MAPTILLADDSPHVRRMGAEYLADLGYEVVMAADGAEALAALGAHTPELILADAALAGTAAHDGLGGMELCRQVKANPAWRAVPVLILLGALARVEAGDLAGADGVLRKPLSSAGLDRWLQRLPASPAPSAPPAIISPEEMLNLAVREAAQGL